MRIKNWAKFQHFKDRRPPWIKLYRDLLDDPDWHDLDPLAAKVLTMLWLIASEADGELPDTRKLVFRLRISENKLTPILSVLSHWLEQDDIKMISPRYQGDAPETETETETEGETEREAKGATAPDIPKALDTLAFREAWGEWVEHKREKRSKLTPTAIKKQMTELSAMGERRAIAAINYSIRQNYQGIFEEKSNGRVAKPDPTLDPYGHQMACLAEVPEYNQ